MNLFIKELKAHWKSLVIWSIALAIFVFLAMTEYSAITGSGNSMQILFENMPKVFQSLLGVGYYDISTSIGYFSTYFIYIMLLGAVHGSMLGANILSAEERDQTSEFLMVKPITRNMVVLSKLLASLVIIVIFNIAVFLFSSLIVNSYGAGQNYVHEIFSLMLGFFTVELIFFFIGFFLSTLLKRAKLAPSIVTGILLVTFIMSVLADMFDSISWFKYLSPFSYFDPKVLLGLINPNYTQISIGLGIILILGFLSFVFYNKRDLEI